MLTLGTNISLCGLVGGGGLCIQSTVVAGLTQACGSVLSHNSTVISASTWGAVRTLVQTSQVVEGSQGTGPLGAG